MSGEAKSATLLGVLRSRPGRPMSTARIIAEAAIPDTKPGTSGHRSAAAVISTCTKRGAGEWSMVQRIAHGTYVYRLTDAAESGHQHAGKPTPEASTEGDWTQVASDGRVIVLRGPDGVLYAAQPIASSIREGDHADRG